MRKHAGEFVYKRGMNFPLHRQEDAVPEVYVIAFATVLLNSGSFHQDHDHPPVNVHSQATEHPFGVKLIESFQHPCQSEFFFSQWKSPLQLKLHHILSQHDFPFKMIGTFLPYIIQITGRVKMREAEFFAIGLLRQLTSKCRT